MEKFIVSARKYRPATFDTVVGQEAVTGTLMNAIKTGHLASAFLFTGPRGVGKTTCARILARTINCENLGADLVACGECAPCKTFEEGHSLNIFELDAASNNSVDDIRNLILQVSIAPQVGTKKVYIIDEVHMLSSAAFNAFLKTLEEPPSYAIFILATTEKHKILPTILSRCQVFDFRRISVNDIARHLADIARKEGIQAEQQALHTIAQKADGGLRDALSIFDQLVSFAGHRLTYQDVVQNLNVLDHEHYFSITNAIAKGDAAACLVELNGILSKGFDGHLFIGGLGRHFRDLLMCQDPRTVPLLEVSDELGQRYAEQAAIVPRELLYQGLEQISLCDSQYKMSKEPRLLVELTLLRLCRPSNGTPIGAPAVASVVASAKAPATEEKKSPDRSAEPLKAAPVAVPAEEPVVATVLAPAPVAVPVEEPVVATAPAPAPPIRRSTGGFSIKQFKEQAKAASTGPALAIAAEPEAEQEALPAGPASAPLMPISENLLRRVWKDYAVQKKREGKNSLHATLIAKEPALAEPRVIAFTIVNEVQEKYLREERIDLVSYLRRELGDPGLELRVDKQEVADLRPRYTPKDRFSIMAERNPALLKLKDALGLDLG